MLTRMQSRRPQAQGNLSRFPYLSPWRAAHVRSWCIALMTLVCWLPPNLARADEGLVIATPELAGETLGTRLDILEDTTGALTIDEITSPALSEKFRRSHENVPGFGLTKSAYWLRWKVANQRAQAQRWLLEVGYPPLDDVRLFVPRPDGSFDLRQTGDHLPFAARDIAYHNFLFELDQPPGVATYYLRVRTSGAITLPLKAWSPNAFLQHLTTNQPPIWIFYGLMLVMAAYNLFLFLSIREITYLYYVCYIVSYAGFQFTLNGLSFQYFWPNQTWWNGKALTLFIGLSFGFGALFNRYFLTTWRWFPRLDRYLLFVGWASFALSLASLVLEYAISIRLLVVWGVHVVLLGLLSAGLAAAQGSRPAIFYVASWLLLLAGIFFYLLRTLGVVPGSFFTDWGLQLGASLEVTLLSLGLADRINMMRGDLEVLNRQLTLNVNELSTALDRAESATRAKSDFLANVSHELRTPLNAIINIPEGLLEDFRETSAVLCDGCKTIFALEAGEHPSDERPCPECRAVGTLRAHKAWTYQGKAEETARYLGYIHKSSKHLLAVVSSILDLSKLEAERMELHVENIELAALLDDTVSPLQQLAAAQGVEVAIAPVPQGSRIQGDRVKIAQIVVNLVGNAIKFSHQGGEVRVEVEAEVDAHVIRVSDEGIGIAPSDRERIFESFSQVDSSNTRKFGGTGLGLTISKKLVELHGGSIWVDSELGRGSTFSVRLPNGHPRARTEEVAPAISAENHRLGTRDGRASVRTGKLAAPGAQ